MAETIQVLIVDDSKEARTTLKTVLEVLPGMECIGEAENGEEALRKLQVLTPDIVVMDINMPVMDGIEATKRIGKDYPSIPVIIVSVQNDAEYVRECLRSGAKDYLFKPIDSKNFEETIFRVYEEANDKRVRDTVSVLTDQFTNQSRVLSFVSSKAGVGKTTIATNLALALSSLKKKVVFVDLDLEFGDAAVFFGLKPTRTLLDLVRDATEIEPDIVNRYVTNFENLPILCAPSRPEEAELITGQHVRVLLQTLRRQFDYIIVDTGFLSNECFFATVESSDNCYVVSTRNLAVLKNNRLLLDLMNTLEFDKSKIHQIISQSNPKHGMKMSLVQKVLDAEIDREFSDEAESVNQSINDGVPLLISNAKNRFTKDIATFAAHIEGEKNTRHLRRSGQRRVFGFR